MAEASVAGVELDPVALTVRASDYGTFTRTLPALARKEGIRLMQALPSDESLESVFSYLVAS
jgi:ABC-2 type transport system ATP-binding protein